MSDHTPAQAIHTPQHAKLCRVKAAAQLAALLDDTGADQARINEIKQPNRAHYSAMMEAAVNNLGLNLEGGI